MPNGSGSLHGRLGANREFKSQAILTIKVVAAMLVIFGGLWLADLFLSP
jgi:hypothetical protein